MYSTPFGDRLVNNNPQDSAHPGLYVRRHVLPRGLTVTEAARRMGVGRPALSNFLNGKAALSPAMAIRLERTFGADREALLALQTKFDARGAPAGRHTVTAATYAPSVVEIKGRDIAVWAARIDARQTLGGLVRRLVNSTGRGLFKVDFGAGDQAEQRGWDGIVGASSPTPWIPEGESGWELSCNARPTGKANDDFAHRVGSVPPGERKARTFVFATPRTWPGKTTWANDKRKLGVWKDVRAYDASDLEQWIEQSVPVQIWFAERLGRPVDGYRSLSQFWSDWADAAEPTLSPRLFAPAVERHSRRFREWLVDSPGRPFTIAADSRAEAIAFVACLPNGEDDGDGDRGIVFDTPSALNRLASAAPGTFVAIAGTREVEEAFSGFRRNIHCVAPRPRNCVDAADSPIDVVLDLPGDDEFRKALEAMGIRRGKADRLALESARSPSILRRRLSVVPAVREPDWGRSRETAGKVIPAAMIGTWHAASAADREIVSLLAGTEYEAVECGVAEMLRLDDPPLWSIGQYRGVVSRLDALFATAPYVTEGDLERAFLVAEYVLSESDPALVLPEGERFMAPVYGKVRDHSKALRRGMGETLILLSEYGERLFGERPGNDGIRIEHRVSELVRKLLSPLDMQKLLSFEADLPELAEAAPQAFLEAVESDLEGGGRIVIELMKPVDVGIFGGGCSRTGILWALECLAWFPEHLPRVVEILAQLSYRNIDDNWTAKPRSSLDSLFRYWMPQTAASIEQRIRALEGLVSRHPEIGWSVALGMVRVSRVPRFASPNCRPRWRGDPSSAGRSIAGEEGDRIVRRSRDICLNWPIHDERTLGDLMESLDDLDHPTGLEVCDLLDRWVDEPQSDHAKESLRERLRRRLLDSKLRTTAIGARLDGTLSKLEPADIVVRHRWLFASGAPVHDFRDTSLTFEERFERVRIRQRDVLRTIWRDRGFVGLEHLIKDEHAARVTGSLMPEILRGTKETVSFVRWCLDRMATRGARWYESCLESFLWRIEGDSLPELVDEISRTHGEGGRLRVLVSMPYRKAWKLLDAEPETFRTAYWERIEFGPGKYSSDDIHEMVDRLLAANRPLAALTCVCLGWDALETSRLVRLLHALADIEEWFDGSGIPDAFTSLDRRSDVPAEDKAKLEFTFFRVLERSEYGMPNLVRQIMSSPAVYAEAVIRAFGREDEVDDPPHLRIDNADRRKDVAMAAYELLEWFHRVPGSDARGVVDPAHLHQWLDDVRALCAQHGRVAVGDLSIGTLLSRAHPDDDDRWPCRAVCEALERISSAEVETGFIIGTSNARGVVTRQIGETGDQERELAAKYRGWAQQVAYEFPRVGAVLERIAEGYDGDASRRDTMANLQRRFPNW